MKRTRLKVKRAERGLRQMEIARRTSIAYSRYVRIENGYTDPTGNERGALARLYQTTVGELFPERGFAAAADHQGAAAVRA